MAQFMPLSELYHQYISGTLKKNEFDSKVFQYLLDNCERYRVFGGNRDRWNEFLSWFYPRLSRTVNLYRDKGSSFDAYMAAIIRSASKEYQYRETVHSITEYVFWQTRIEELAILNYELEYPEVPELSPVVFLPSDIKPKHILMLLLKSYDFVPDDFVQKIANAIGVEITYIRELIDRLHQRRLKREDEIRTLKERLYCQHYRYLAYQARMNAAFPGSFDYEMLKDRVVRAGKRFDSMKKRLQKMRQDATNQQVAEVLGIPKGTVDSTLHMLKNKWKFQNDPSSSENQDQQL
jgi:Arc/MetJ-type ribon-helix-helix transcriptional regulator